MAQCLVIDDSDVIRFVLNRILDRLGHTAHDTKDVAEAVEKCTNEDIDVIFLDWDMPGLQALDFLKSLSELPEDKKPEIILCATENDVKQFSLAKSAGAAHHILKPYDVTSIRSIMKHVGLHQPGEVESMENMPPLVSQAQAG